MFVKGFVSADVATLESSVAKTIFVTTRGKTTSHADMRDKFQRLVPTCHFCGVRGRIRPGSKLRRIM